MLVLNPPQQEPNVQDSSLPGNLVDAPGFACGDGNCCFQVVDARLSAMEDGVFVVFIDGFWIHH